MSITTNNRHFLLVGNGPYSNRGCEAIVRGTMAILRHEFGDSVRATLVTFASERTVARQAARETDSAIAHVAHSWATGRWSPAWAHRQILKCLHPLADVYHRPRDLPGFLRAVPYRAFDGALQSAAAVLQVGGDNYSLDYGWPETYLALDRHVRRRHRPLFLWGASVGPFDATPAFAREAMFRHLSAMNTVFVRESASLEYLQTKGVDNVVPVCDPAFAMEPVAPPEDRIGFPLPEGALGINLSPLMATYVTAGDMAQWTSICTDLVSKILATSRRPVLLIPHVTSDTGGMDDLTLLRRVAAQADPGGGRVRCLPGTLSAAELKWVIARCSAFVGARTHATIAAISSGVPTLSLAYSRKAVGINRDVFGTQDYCVAPSDLTRPGLIVERLSSMLASESAVHRRLSTVLPGIVKRAFAAGKILHSALSGGAVPGKEGW